MILRLVLFLFFLSTPLLSQNPTIGLIHHSDQSDDGYTLFTPENNNFVYLINQCGYKINSWEFDDVPNRTAYLLQNGSVLRAGIEKIQIRDWYNEEVWSYSTNSLQQHHDIEPLPNGNILVITYDYYSREEILEKGKSQLFEEDSIRLDKIIEIKPVGTNEIEIVWEWRLFDHLIQDVDSTLDNYGVISNHPELMNINYSQELNFSHVNSIDYNEELDQILISARNLSEIFIIDHSTTIDEAAGNTGGIFNRGGDFLWRWGNKNNYLLDSSANQLYRQHDAKWVNDGFQDDGKITVFNNNPGGNSSLMIIQTEINSDEYVINDEGYLPQNEEFSWSGNILGQTLQENRKAGVMSLKNGNLLVCETSKGRISEIKKDGSLLWSYINPTGEGIFDQYSDTVNGTGIFRAIRYQKEFRAFENFELDLGTIIEDENTLSNGCQKRVLSSKNFQTQSLVVNNPVHNQTLQFVDKEMAAERLVIYDMHGRAIFTRDEFLKQKTLTKKPGFL
jgi:hypothetical protein